MTLHEQIMNLPQRLTVAIEHPTQYEVAAYSKGHRDARHAAAELAIKADAVIEAARAVLAFRVDTPTRGDLRDNIDSRDALRDLAAAVAAVGAA
jgi:hypothetical protein